MPGERPTRPRIAPIKPGEETDEQKEVLAQTAMGSLNIFHTLAHYPGLLRRWLPFGGKLLQGSKLPERHRELVILRVAWNTRARYEWAQHVGIARRAGVSDEEIERIAEGPAASGWSEVERLLLTAVDELHADHCISDATWAALEGHLDVKQLIELPMLAGHYVLLAGALNSLGVQPEDPKAPQLGKAV